MKRIAAAAMALALVPILGLPTGKARAGDAVKVGVLTDMGGPYADVGGRGSVIAAEMAVRDFGGSVLGKPISVLSADNQEKPDVATAIARRWYDEGVEMITDLSGSPMALAVQALATEKKRIAITTTASNDALTNQQCSPFGAHWVFDSYSTGKTVAPSLAAPGSTWFFLTVDNAGGEGLQKALVPFLQANGARVLGSVRHPLGTADMSSFLLQAQASGAKYIALANAGQDLVNVMKQAQEFGLAERGQTPVGMTVFMSTLKAMGLDAANGMLFATGFVSSASPEAAAWSKRFFELYHAMPNDVQAGVYSAVLHYLRAVQSAGTDQAEAVMAKMRELPVNDMFARNGVLRKDGRMVHDMYLVQAKTPSESTGPWDLVKIVKVIPGAEAFRPLSDSACPLVKASQ